MNRIQHGRKRLSVYFTDEQAAWIEEQGRKLREKGYCHMGGGESEVVRMAVNRAMSDGREIHPAE